MRIPTVCPQCAAECAGQGARCAYCGGLLPAPAGGNGGRRKTIAATRGRARARTAGGDRKDLRIERLIREAAGGEPAARGRGRSASREEQEEEILRELVGEAFDLGGRAEERPAAAEFQPLRYLYTARSFSSPEEMGRSTRVVRLLLGSHRRAAGRLQRAVERAKGRIEAMPWSVVEKRRFWKELTEGFVARYRIGEALLDRQREWTEATVELYEFVLCHSEGLSFEGRMVRSRNDVTGREFLARLNHAKQCREEFRRESLQEGAEQGAGTGNRGYRDLRR